MLLLGHRGAAVGRDRSGITGRGTLEEVRMLGLGQYHHLGRRRRPRVVLERTLI